ncbi:NADPH-dependent FMN reductase [Nocardia sp. CDC160]|uniref:NADPH-dependent FMN reductase n=1 Tax=Nocardia sp. CDC160 TaxID=3112166 RepID=UPI002DBFB3C0|nr:NADPH-dependent FMN reductase [Nocardia sp. CDC160]MEC3918460.1 NADPH-dependent FMN reductase [Nocardia sp. CDC160]
MPTLLILSGSPSATSRTAALSEHLAQRLRGHGHLVTAVRVRDLPADALLSADATDPAVAAVVAGIAEADGVVVASPVYKAAYSGVLKTLLDLLPQFALAGKVVLPVVTGGSPAHVLAIDYALRPVLSSLGADHIVPGWFVLDQHIEPNPDRSDVTLDPRAAEALYPVVDAFSAAVSARRVPATAA